MISSQANAVFTRASSTAHVANVVTLADMFTRLLISEPVRQWRPAVVERLECLVRLEPGWDGYNGVPVSFEIATFALRMLEAACGYDCPCPQIVPGSEGDLQIEWHTHLGDIELDVLGPNNVVAWRKTNSCCDDGEQIPLTNDFAVVAKWIKELTEPAGVIGTAAA